MVIVALPDFPTDLSPRTMTSWLDSFRFLRAIALLSSPPADTILGDGASIGVGDSLLDRCSMLLHGFVRWISTNLWLHYDEKDSNGRKLSLTLKLWRDGEMDGLRLSLAALWRE